LGWPQRMPSKGRGPKPKRTQYDDAFNARRGLYQKLVRLPRQSKAATEASIPKRHETGQRTSEIIAEHVAELRRDGVPGAHLVSEIVAASELHPPTFNKSTVRRHLLALGIKGAD
ncbi:MAG TPA: hypothetical protein VNF46_03765, partial [Gammaproteobacteria bacterium]|nr:hypothetical protein [Gammaproteobacteria bacterium]